MPDLLDALIARSSGSAGAIEPRVPALFEPARRDRAGDVVVPAVDRPREAAVSGEPDDRTAIGADGGRIPIESRRETRVDRSPGEVEPAAASAPRRAERHDTVLSRLMALEHRLDQQPWRVTRRPAVEVPRPAAPSRAVDGDDRAQRLVAAPARGEDHARHTEAQPAVLPAQSTVGDSLTRRLDALTRNLAESRAQPTAVTSPPLISAGADRTVAPRPPLAAAKPATASGHVLPAPRRTLEPRLSALPAARHHTLVEVTIGRVELRAAVEATRPPAERTDTVAPTSLGDYLRRRNGGSR